MEISQRALSLYDEAVKPAAPAAAAAPTGRAILRTKWVNIVWSGDGGAGSHVLPTRPCDRGMTVSGAKPPSPTNSCRSIKLRHVHLKSDKAL